MCKISKLYHSLSKGEGIFNMFFGEYPYKVDEKGRGPIPTQFTMPQEPLWRFALQSTMWAQLK